MPLIPILAAQDAAGARFSGQHALYITPLQRGASATCDGRMDYLLYKQGNQSVGVAPRTRSIYIVCYEYDPWMADDAHGR